MPFDVEVYGRVALLPRELAKVISSVTGPEATSVHEVDSAGAVVRDASGQPRFTVDGPFRLEPEDVEGRGPDIAGSTVLYSIRVPYAMQADVSSFHAVVDGSQLALAVPFASRLAERVGGTVVDPQVFDEPQVFET